MLGVLVAVGGIAVCIGSGIVAFVVAIAVGDAPLDTWEIIRWTLGLLSVIAMGLWAFVLGPSLAAWTIRSETATQEIWRGIASISWALLTIAVFRWYAVLPVALAVVVGLVTLLNDRRPSSSHEHG